MTIAVTAFISLYASLLSLIFGYDEAELVFVGDAMQHSAQLDAARVGKTDYDYSHYFDSLPACVTMADLAVVNLETPVGNPPYTGYPCFNAPSQFATALRDAGFDLFLTANNHTLDHGAKGVHNTIEHLDTIGVHHIGTYHNKTARDTIVPLVLTVNNIKIAFLNYTYGTNGISPSQGVSVDYIDRSAIKADVATARANGAEAVIVCIHWGDEYVLLPNKNQRNTADFLEALGVDMIIGSHPHVIQPMELRPNKYYPDKNIFIVYSLGNFVSNMKTPDTRGGALARAVLKRADDGSVTVDRADYRLLFTIPGLSPKDNYKVLQARRVDIPQWRDRAKMFVRRACDIFNKHNIGVQEATD